MLNFPFPASCKGLVCLEICFSSSLSISKLDKIFIVYHHSRLFKCRTTHILTSIHLDAHLLWIPWPNTCFTTATGFTKKDNLNIVTVPTKNYMIQKMHKDYFNFNKVLKFDQREEKSWLLSSVDNDTYVL